MARAQPQSPGTAPHLPAVRVTHPPHLHGRLDEHARRAAPAPRPAGGGRPALRLPRRTLRSAPRPPQGGAFRARRSARARQETDGWAYTPPPPAGGVPPSEKPGGRRHLRPPSPFELRPFAL